MQPEITVTLRGKTLSDLVAQANALISAAGVTTTPTVTRTKPAVQTTAVEAEESLLGDDADEVETENDSLSLDDIEDEVVAPVQTKTTKTKAAPKLTDKDVNDAAVKYAKKHGKKATMAILAKFKVKSILELDAKDYAKVVKALEL